ncbi:hypothetical protein VE02_08095 [Pseudogymnoascus sp. 03VT05]|nr:hypothetical protein VE02_08095 [Pseudogymnoascus sp. 03VT05]
MASQPPPPSHTDSNSPAPLTYSEQLALHKHEMALEYAEIQHQRDIAVLNISRLRHEITLRIETERELERVAKKETERRRQEASDNKDIVDWVVEFSICVVLTLLVAALVMGPMDMLQRMACLLEL